MTIRWRVVGTALLLPVVLASCAAAPGAPEEPGTVTNGGRPVTSRPAVSVPSVPSPSGFVPSFPGDVAPGSVRWGSSISGNGDPVARHESTAGVPLGVRRTFYGWDQRTGSMVRNARNDIAAGRLPWVSIKTPGWAAVASGAYDAQIDEMLRALDSVGGPVWFTAHHEPEGGNGTAYPDEGQGSEKNWRAMQIKIRERMDVVQTRNIAFASILMSWTFNPQSKRNPADWWVDGIWDFAGVDYYNDKESRPSMETDQWTATRAFYGAKGLKIGVAEWGNRGTDVTAANEMTGWYEMALRSAGQPGLSQVIGLSYFDSGLNSPTGAWTLAGEPLNRFRQILGLPNSISVNEVG